jgi:hypothetical protein
MTPRAAVRFTAPGLIGTAILCISCGGGGAHGIRHRWLLLREPIPGTVVLGETWDGKTSYGHCFEFTVRVDTSAGEDREMTMTPADSEDATPILERVGLRALARRVGTWELRGLGGHRATAVDPVPTFSDRCAPAHGGLPAFPVITDLLGYDSLVIAWTPDTSAMHALVLEDFQPVRELAATLHVSPGRISISRGEPVWVGYRAMAVVGDGPSDRTPQGARSYRVERFASEGDRQRWRKFVGR